MINRLGFFFLLTIVAFGLAAGAMAVSPPSPPQRCWMSNCCATVILPSSKPSGDAAQPPCCKIESPPSPGWLALTVRPAAADGDAFSRPALATGSLLELKPPCKAGPLPHQHSLPQSKVPVYIQTLTLLC